MLLLQYIMIWLNEHEKKRNKDSQFDPSVVDWIVKNEHSSWNGGRSECDWFNCSSL